MGRTIVFLIILAMLPAVAAQPTEPGIYNPEASTPTTMYFHMSGIQDVPINTQKPSDIYADLSKRGVGTPSSCVEVPDVTTLAAQSQHTWYGFSSPSIVEYDVDNGGEPRYHPERGISYDVELDSSVTPTLHWFLQQDNGAPDEPVDGDTVPLVYPEVIVRGTVREGDEISVNNEAFNTGSIVAQGQTEKVQLAGALSTETEFFKVHEYEGTHVYEFIVEMPIQDDTISKDEAYNVRIDAFMDNALCPEPEGHEGGDYVMGGGIYAHTSEDHRPRVHWNIMNPLYIEALHPQFVGDDLVIHTASNSPWGSYDVMGDISLDPGNIELEITGPTVPVSFNQVKIEDNTRNHDNHGEAVTAVWIWEYKEDNAPDGVYTVTMRIVNDQETAEALAVATFQIGNSNDDTEVCSKNIGDDEVVCVKPDSVNTNQESPGVGLVALFAALGAAFVARRK